ncbi:MAG: hypothetical protein ACJ71N_08825 [Terriglobales bacterium]
MAIEHVIRPAVLILAFLAVAAAESAADAGCKIVDLTERYSQVAKQSGRLDPKHQVELFRRQLVLEHPDLYGENGLGFKSRSDLDAAIVRALGAPPSTTAKIQKTARAVERSLPEYVRVFEKTFPDFRCDFSIYVVNSLNRLDGAGRVIEGKPSLILGADVIASEPMRSRGILIIHELFHRYHYEVAGFSDDDSEHNPLWRALWVEGLATYVSMRLNPPASMQDALIAPSDLVLRAKRIVPELIGELRPNLDRSDPQLFASAFKYRGPDANPPSRFGYYLGTLLAQEMAKTHSLTRLAHMGPREVREAIGVVLQRLQLEFRERSEWRGSHCVTRAVAAVSYFAFRIADIPVST